MTFSYTMVTTAAILMVEILVFGGVFAYFLSNALLTPEEIFTEVEEGWVPIVKPYLSESPQDIQGLRTFLQQFWGFQVGTDPILITANLELDFKSYNFLSLIFLNEAGVPIDAIPHELVTQNKAEDQEMDQGERTPVALAGKDSRLYTLLRLEDETEEQINPRGFTIQNYQYIREIYAIPGFQDMVKKAMAGSRNYETLIVSHDNKYTGVIPVFDVETHNKVVGAVIFTTKSVPWGILPVKEILMKFGYSILIITLIVALFGTLFGSLTAGGLAKRIQRLSLSTHAWSKGDFSVFVEDKSQDELSKLANDLNAMAQQLETLLSKRQEMSVLEERNRLARDLHDSVKQQAFAASAQLGAAKALFETDKSQAKGHLEEAENLVDQVRQELTNLIYELHPGSLEEEGLSAILSAYIYNWAKRQDITVDLLIDCKHKLPLEHEQMVLRVTQEALANIARHSQAKNVNITIHCPLSGELALAIEDDGNGFDLEKVNRGMGLKSMWERADLLGGCLKITSQKNKGTRIEVNCQV